MQTSHTQPAATGRALRALALALTTALAATLACAAPSFAARGHEFGGSFGGAGSGPGQFDGPGAIAVNETTGEVYVVDEKNNRVEIFNAAGTKLEGEFNGSGSLPNEGKAAGTGGQSQFPEVPTEGFDEPEGIAVDNDPSSPSFGDVYVVDKDGNFTFAKSPVVDKFSATGKYIGQITRNPTTEKFSESGFRYLFGVAVDPRGVVWVEEQNFGSAPEEAADYSDAVANVWLGSRSTLASNSRKPAPGLAVDSKDNLYVHNNSVFGDRIAKYNETGELLTGEVDEEVPTGVAVEAGSDDVYIAHADNVDRVSPAGVSLERLVVSGPSSFSGVAVNASTLTVYVSDAGADRVDIFTPEAPGVPTVQPGSEGVADVTGTSATFAAEVNPRSELKDTATSYSFRYGPCDTPTTCVSSPYSQSIPVPEGVLVANYEPDVVGAHPQDLLPGMTYHVRVQAHNSHGEGKPGEELVFTTQIVGPPSAADGRRYELVSSPDKFGATLLPLGLGGAGLVQASVSGDAIAYSANAPTEAAPAGFSQTMGILSRRVGSSWESRDIATPHEATVGYAAVDGEYRFFSEDLSGGVVAPSGPFTKALSPNASERTLYLRSDFPAGDPSHPCVVSCYRPLVVGCPGGGEPCPPAIEEAANVLEGTKFGEEGTCEENCGPYFLGASPDASHVVLTAKAKLTEDGQGDSVYEWEGGKLAFVSVLPDGKVPVTGSKLGFVGNGGSPMIARHAISSDGGRVVWSTVELDGAKQPAGEHLYLRRMSGEPQTIQLDTPETACTTKGGCKGTASPVFQTASADDSRIFFTDTQPLTQNAGNSDLYECQVEEDEEGQLHCNLSDLTPPGSGEAGAGVLGLIVGASENGSVIYFTANGKLSPEPNAHGQEAVTGNCHGDTTSGAPESETAPERCNLYEYSAGQTRLVAVLSGADFPDWSITSGLDPLSDRVSPNGRYLAFMSRQSLSGYDNRDARSGKPDQEVFLYDNQANNGHGGLLCASCDPTGGRPHGVQYSQIDAANGGLAGGSQVWPESAWIAAIIPGWTPINGQRGFALHQPRYLSDQGRLFFNSADALAPQDTNSTTDVYEYEPPTIGDCTTENSTYSPHSNGCVALISSGTAKGESAFLDASQTGNDIFFLTAQRLLPNQDIDASLDVYDAHACTTTTPCQPPPPTPPPACEGDSCQTPTTPPQEQTPGSLTYLGPGNLTPPLFAKPTPKSKPHARTQKLANALATCHKSRPARKRHACERAARRKYGVSARKRR